MLERVDERVHPFYLGSTLPERFPLPTTSCGADGYDAGSPASTIVRRALMGLPWKEERMTTSPTISFRKVALRLVALPLALAPLAGAVADDRDTNPGSEA